MALQGSPHKPMAPLPKRKASASSIRDASSLRSPTTSTFSSRTSPAHPSPAHSPSASASPLPTGTFEPPAPVIEQNAQFGPPGMHERAFFPGTISDPFHPQYQYPHHHQLHRPASASNKPMTLDEYDDYDNDNYESPPEHDEEEEEEQEPEGRSWPSNMRHTTYAGHPPAKPDFATNHFSQSADRLAFLAHTFAELDQREELQRIIGPGFSVKSGSQFLGAPSRNAADEGIAITAQCGVKLGRALRREGSWMPDTAAGRAEQKRRDEEKKEKLKLDPPGYPQGGLTEWNEDTEKEDGGVLKVKKKKNKKKKKGKKVAGADEADADAGSEGNAEAEELDRAEQGGVPALKDDADLGDKVADAEAVEAAPTVNREVKVAICGAGDKPTSTDFESTVEHHTSELTPATATAAPEPEPEQPEPELNSEEERAKRKEDKLQRDKERKAAKKERANKKKEALGIVKKPWVPPPPPVEEAKVEEPEPKSQKKAKVKKAKAEPVEKKEVEDGDQAALMVRVDEPMAEKTGEAEPTVIEPAVEQTTVEQPAVAKPATQQPASQPVMEQPAVEERPFGKRSDEDWRQRAAVPAVQKNLDKEQEQAQVVHANTSKQSPAQNEEAAQAFTPHLKKPRRRREKNTTQSPISSKTPLRPPQAERPHTRHVSAKAQLSWTQLHPETAVSIQVNPPDRPVSTPPISFLAQPASPLPETLTSTPARLASGVSPVSHSPPAQPSADNVEAQEMFLGQAEQRRPAPESELEDQSEGKSQAETDVPGHLNDETEVDYPAVPDLTSSSAQSTNNTSVRTPESSPLRPLVKLPVIEQKQEQEEEGPGEEDVPCIQVESPSARASHIAEKAAEEDVHGGITETGERVTSPTLTETSADVIEEEGKGMLGVSYTQDRATTPAFNGVEVAAQDERNSDNKAEGPGSPAFNENTHNRHFPLARTWKLYFSDTDKARSAARAAAMGQLAVDSGGRSTAQSYSSSLIKLIESGDVADLFGKWKALRRQVAVMTGREIEEPGTAPAADKLGLGLHTMSDDHNFQFFVKGVKPMWEDRMCKMGGKISFTGTCEQLDSFFFEAVLTLISNILPSACPSPGNSIQVVGVAFGRKPKPAAARVDIWFGGLAKVPADYAMSVQNFLVQHINVEGVSALKGGYKEFYTASASAGSGVGGGGGMSRKASGVVGSEPGPGHGRTGSGISTAGSPMLGQGAPPAFGAFASFGAFGGARNASSTQGVPVPVVLQGRPQHQQNTHHQLGQQLQRPQQPEAELSAPKQEAQKTPFEQHHTQHVANPEAQVAEQPPEQVQHPAVQQQYRILTRPPVEARHAHEAPAPAPVDSDPLRITVPVPMLSPVAQAVLYPPAPAQAPAPTPAPAMLPPLTTSNSVPLVDVLSVPTNPLLSSVLPTTPLITPIMSPHGTPPTSQPPPDMYPMQDQPYLQQPQPQQQPQYGYEYGYEYGPPPGFSAMQLPLPEMIHPLPLPPHSHLHMQMQAQSQIMQMQMQQQHQPYHYQYQQQQPQHHLPPGLYVQPDGRVMQYAHPETQPQPQPQSHIQIQAQDQLQPQLQPHHQASAGQLYQARPPRPPHHPQHHHQQQQQPHAKQRHPLAAPPPADADVHVRGHSEGARPNGQVHGKGNETGFSNGNGGGRGTRGKRGARGGQVPMGVGMGIGRKGHGRGEGGGRMASTQSNAV